MTFNLKIAALSVAVAAAMFSVVPAQAFPGPPAQRDFCSASPMYCRGGGAAVMPASQELMALINSVNRQVNRSIAYRSERGDTWSVYPEQGDCEDFALTKRAELIKRGVSPGSLRMALTTTRRGQPHAVLVVKTSEGDYILDNFTNEVRVSSRSSYRLIAVASANPRVWTPG